MWKLPTLLLLLLLLTAGDAAAQRRMGRRWVEPIPSWGVDGLLRSSVLLDDEVRYAGGRVGRQLDSTLNVGLAGTLLLSGSAETHSVRGIDRVTSLLYLGPSLELRDSLRGPLRALVRTSIVGGLLGYERMRDGVRTDGTAAIIGVEPELGLQLRATRNVQLTMTIGVLCAWRLDDGARLVTGPIGSVGIRLLR